MRKFWRGLAIVASLGFIYTAYVYLTLPDVRDRMLASGTLPVGTTPARFGELLRDEIQKWRRIIQQAGISPGAS